MSAWAHYGRQVSRFAVVGLASTLVHVAVFNLLVAWFAMPPLAANLAGFALAFGLSFSAHSGWTFSARQGAGSVVAPTQRGAELTKFFATALAGFALNSLIVFVTMDWAKLPSAAPSVLMVTVTPLFLFALNRFWVFSGRFEADATKGTRPSLSAQARRDLRWLAVVGLATLLCLAPLFIPGELGKGGDARFHLVWQNALLRTWSWTSPYPRWMPDLVDGFGSPAFFIYPPVAHFVAGAFRLFLPDTHHTELRLVLAIALATAIGAAGFFAWMRERGLRRGAWAATALYTLAPYHIYVDLFHRGAFAELFAFAWAPWIFLAIGRLRSDPALAAPGLAISTALLLATHIPSSILLLPAAGLYAVWMHGRPGSWPALGLYAWSSFCGLLLAGFYLGTAVTHGAYIDTAALFGGRSESWRWLLGFASWPDTGIQKVVMIVAGLQTALLLGLLMDLWRERRLRETPLVLYAGLCGLAAFALMTQASAPVWHLQTILNKIQFPWRLLFVQTLAVALLIGVWAERSRWASLATPALVALLLGVNGSLLLYHDFVARPAAGRSLRALRSTGIPSRADGRAASPFPRGHKSRLHDGTGRGACRALGAPIDRAFGARDPAGAAGAAPILLYGLGGSARRPADPGGGRRQAGRSPVGRLAPGGASRRDATGCHALRAPGLVGERLGSGAPRGDERPSGPSRRSPPGAEDVGRLANRSQIKRGGGAGSASSVRVSSGTQKFEP